MQTNGLTLHNVARTLPVADGVLLDRVPAAVFAQLDEPATHTSNNASGVELRFVMQADTVQLTLRAQAVSEPQIAYLMYGDFAADWAQGSFVLGPTPRTLTLHRPANLARLQAVAQAAHARFDPAVMRLCLPYCRNVLMDVQGAITPPTPAQLPARTYLAYGSSITHGTLALSPQATYAARVATHLDADLLNFGFPGSAWLEPAVADYLCGRKDWQVASLEMGINMLGAFSVADFRQRVRRFIAPFAADPRLVVATDMVVTDYPEDPAKVAAFRRVVAEETAGKLPYISGLALLPDLTGLSGDLLHPSPDGMATIAAALSHFIAAQGGF